MFILGLTGGMGMGKSAASNYFNQLNIPVHDSDASVHKLMMHNGSLYNKLKKLIPEAVNSHNINRQILSAKIREKPELLQELEAIIHPEVRKDRNYFIHKQARLNHKLIVLDVPLLFETGWYKNCDRIALVDCPLWLQKQRILSRGVSSQKMKILLNRQWKQEKRKLYADYLIQTGLSFAVSKKDIRHILKHISYAKTKKFSPKTYSLNHTMGLRCKSLYIDKTV